MARQIELDRVDALMRTAWVKATAKSPDPQWFDRAIRCVELRAKLLGLLTSSGAGPKVVFHPEGDLDDPTPAVKIYLPDNGRDL